MSASRDRRKLDQAARALRRASDWINDLDTVRVDGTAHDSLGEVIYAVDKALEEADWIKDNGALKEAGLDA